MNYFTDSWWIAMVTKKPLEGNNSKKLQISSVKFLKVLFRCASISILYPCQKVSKSLGRVSDLRHLSLYTWDKRHRIIINDQGWRIMSSCRHVNLSSCHLVILSSCHLVNLSSCHLVNLSSCQLVNLSSCHLVILSSCHLIILSTCHLVNLPSC